MHVWAPGISNIESRAFSSDVPLAGPCHARASAIAGGIGRARSFREAAKLLNELTPCARQNHVTTRNRLATVANDFDSDDRSKASEANQRSKSSELTVFLDSAYVRSRPEYQRRNFEIVVGSIESKGREKRRFGLSVIGADNPREYLRRNLEAAGWHEGAMARRLQSSCFSPVVEESSIPIPAKVIRTKISGLFGVVKPRDRRT